MNALIKDWKKQIDLLTDQITKLDKAIAAVRSVCPHEKTTNIGHDSHKDCYECLECGHREWI